MMYPPNSGYSVAQYPGGAPFAVPMQGGSGMVPVQTVTPGSQGGQPQMVVVPATTYQPQAPPAYGHGAYTKLENEDVRVKSQTFVI